MFFIISVVVILVLIFLAFAASGDGQSQDGQEKEQQELEQTPSGVEPKLGEELWDDVVEWTEQLNLRSDSLWDYYQQLRELKTWEVTVEDVKRFRGIVDEFMSFQAKISAELDHYRTIIDPNKIKIELRPDIVVVPKLRHVLGKSTPDFQALATLYEDKYYSSLRSWQELKGRTRHLEFYLISKAHFQSSPQAFLNSWFWDWKEQVKKFNDYVTAIQLRQIGGDTDVQANQLSPAFSLFWIPKCKTNADLQILQDWFELDGLAVLCLSGDSEMDMANLKGSIMEANVVLIDNIDKLLTILPSEQKEDLFDLLVSRRKRGDVIIIYVSSNSAESLSVYDYDRLDLHQCQFKTF